MSESDVTQETQSEKPPPYTEVPDDANASSSGADLNGHSSGQHPPPSDSVPADKPMSHPNPAQSGGPPQTPSYPVQQGIQVVPFGQPMAPSTNYTLKQSGGFLIIDFYPRCLKPGRKGTGQLPEFEPFSCLVRQANHWLSTNPNNRVIRCESVEMDADFSGAIKAESCVQTESGLVVNIYVRSLRLWCRSDVPQTAPGFLWYLNVVPLSRFPGQPLVKAVEKDYEFVEGLSETIQRLNHQLSMSPLPGSVISVEQVELKLSSSSRLGTFDLDISCWAVNPERRRYFLSCVRVFYVMEPGATPERIGVTVVAPEGSVKPLCRSKWSNFNEVMNATAAFLLSNPNLRVTNIQTIKYPKKIPNYKDGPVRDLSIDVNPTFHTFSSESTFVYAIWVGYTVKTDPWPAFASGLITCRTFLPYKVSGNTYETKGQCLDRISAWMNISKNRLVTMETLSVYHNPRHEVIHDEKMSHESVEGTLQHRVTLFRLYFDGPITEPPPHLLPQPKKDTSRVCSLL